jgi:ABC-type antimicrobial peptide transport system permease subunit
MLFSVTAATDPWAYAGAFALRALIAGAEVFGPARRASKLDPVTALRQE